MKKISFVLRRLLHADLLILAASALLLVAYFFADLRIRISPELPPYSSLLRCTCLVLICLISYLGGLLHRQRTGSNRLSAALLYVYFGLYLFLLLSFTLFDAGLRLTSDRLTDPDMTKRQYYLRWFVNLKPFQSIYTVYIQGLINGYVSMRYTLLNLLGNLCAFMPFAFFLPAFFKSQKKWFVFLPTMLLIVAAIEGMQFWLMVGSCDIDDLILNAGGAVALFWFLRIPPIQRLCQKIAGVGDRC